MKAQTKNKLSILALVLVFVAPVIVAIVMNSQWVNYSPETFKNKGEFIQPPIKITDYKDLNTYEGYWTVVYHHSGVCDDACNSMLETLYRIRLTKGHKMKKVKLLTLHPENDTVNIPEQFNSINQQTFSAGDQLSQTLGTLSQQSLGNGKGLYLLAPEGFLMMAYPQNFDPSDVIDDLGLLLRARKNEG